MIRLLLGWTLLTGTLWSLGSSQTLLQEQVKVLYPKINDSETVECECFNVSCDYVFWFRSPHNTVTFEYIGRSNNADRDAYSNDLFKSRFKIRKRSGVSYTLRINRVTQEDTGIYSCVLKDNRYAEVWRPGVLLLPGVIPPTPPPKPKPKPPRSGCKCNKKNQKSDECGSMVLWPLVGLIAGLSVAILCTLYYFSRLPKKCRHHFAKK
ncbi:uncharacterized protein cd8b [Sphaeramia orbicularis]|uniref:Uncharacterized LOC115419784 n=1 Tax=Sphaeramia orbicularis TaxID=375764 RepID=A0A672Y5D7_9TELE|nr:uncharacterized protein LOC115419784 [Sphaeramia orbicularis]